MVEQKEEKRKQRLAQVFSDDPDEQALVGEISDDEKPMTSEQEEKDMERRGYLKVR